MTSSDRGDGAILISRTFSHQDEEEAANDCDEKEDDMHLSESPRTVAVGLESFICANRSFGSLPSPPPLATEEPPLLSYEEGFVDVKRSARKRRLRLGGLGGPPSPGDDKSNSYKLAYRIYRPELLETTERAPLLVLHGGPSLPSQYLHPISERFPDRAVVFYDQLGCGASSAPPDHGGSALYSLSKSIDDLEALLRSLQVPRFHLLGHSFGGVLAYEFCKRLAERRGREDPGWRDDPEVLSVTLANAFTSAGLCDAERERLFDRLSAPPCCDAVVDDEEEEEDVEGLFWQQHQCTLPTTPSVLEDSMQNWGVPWHERTNSPLASYEATAPSRWASHLPPALVLRGENDFVTEACVQGWGESVWNHREVTQATLEGCAHYCHLEDEAAFGDLVGGFCLERDP